MTIQPPQPKDGRLSLEVAGGEVAAVLRFEGSATREATLRAVAQLKDILASGDNSLASLDFTTFPSHFFDRLYLQAQRQPDWRIDKHASALMS